ncbi:MAG TPA: hypothetical protein VFC82_05675 [Actinomycetaceae bacterium]|nr:hypothetical protein [Actinomycetaceae bacterium]
MERNSTAADGSATKLEAWMQSCQEFRRTEQLLEGATQSAAGLSLNELYLLHHLLAEPEHKFRVQDAARLIQLSQSATSRLVMRLASLAEPAVERRMCEIDKRGVYIHLTEAGRKLHAQAAQSVEALL